MRSVGRRVHSGSLCIFWCALGVVGSLGVAGFISVRPGGRWVHLGAPRVSSGSFGVVRFIRVRSGDRQVHSVSLGSFWLCPGDRCVQLGPLGSFLDALAFVGLIQGRWVHLGAR